MLIQQESCNILEEKKELLSKLTKCKCKYKSEFFLPKRKERIGQHNEFYVLFTVYFQKTFNLHWIPELFI